MKTLLIVWDSVGLVKNIRDGVPHSIDDLRVEDVEGNTYKIDDRPGAKNAIEVIGETVPVSLRKQDGETIVISVAGLSM